MRRPSCNGITPRRTRTTSSSRSWASWELWALACFSRSSGAAVIPACRQAGRPPPPAMLAPVVVGLVGFLVAGLLMHPLLLPEVSAAFWLALGLARSAQLAAPIEGTPLRLRVLVPALIALGLIVSLPARITAARHAVNLDGVGVGLSHWRRDGDSGLRYRRARGSSTIYVDGRPGRLRVPLRLVGSPGLPTDVEFLLDGRPAGSLTLASDEWRELSIVLPEPAHPDSALPSARFPVDAGEGALASRHRP